MDESVKSTSGRVSARQPEQTNIKETIESILVAFILAFMFRAFVVEAFVIPTGSMAPTLLGAHMRYRCYDCGYEFEVNYQSQDSDGSDDVSIPATARLNRPVRDPVTGATTQDKTFRIHCPNCGYRMPRANPADPTNVATNAPVYYGDRILVLKYLYLLQNPRRWDVVVFKSPADPQEVHDYSQNYIKRLIGRPGESILILDGDVYVSSKGADSTADDFEIQTKPRWAQEALWRIVYDNDFQPRLQTRPTYDAFGKLDGADPLFVQPWQPDANQTGWDLTSKRVFKFDNTAGSASLNYNADANPMPGTTAAVALTDWLAYDNTLNQSVQAGGRPAPPDMYKLGGYTGDNNVSDVKVSCFYTRQSGDGVFAVKLVVRPGTDIEKTFVAELDRTNATLKMLDRNGESTTIGTAALPVDSSQPTKVELIHADYHVTLRAGDKTLVETSADQYKPDLAFLLNNYRAMARLPKPKISLVADKQQAEIRHLSLWRDVYYTNRERATGNTVNETAPRGPLNWGTPEDFPRRVITLGKDEYFCCGDNSLISGDGRYWDKPIDLPAEDLHALSGRVPGRFLLGKAFFVYWPAGYKPVAGDSVPAIVPNFGKMRFIH